MKAYLNIVSIYEGLNIIRMDKKKFVIVWCCVTCYGVASHDLKSHFII
jgi:hypothetical protein